MKKIRPEWNIITYEEHRLVLSLSLSRVCNIYSTIIYYYVQYNIMLYEYNIFIHQKEASAFRLIPLCVSFIINSFYRFSFILLKRTVYNYEYNS